MSLSTRTGHLVLIATLAAVGSRAQAAPVPDGLHAYRLYTGQDGNSHVEEGVVPQRTRLPVAAISVAMTPAHAPPVWHNDPQWQYVVTMTGTLRFTTRSGESFTLRPGDVLIAEDNTGTGHGWTLLGDAPWIRTYAIVAPGVTPVFIAMKAAPGR